MNFKITGKNFEITDALKEKINKKIGKINKFFAPQTDAHITMSVVKNRHILEITIVQNNITLRAEVEGDDMYSCIDKAESILEGQIRKNKTRLEKKLHTGVIKPEDFTSGAAVEEEHEFKVVRTKRFAIKPMTVEEAILQMNLLGHEFFMFLNSETGKANVVYRRKYGDYGLIEPELD